MTDLVFVPKGYGFVPLDVVFTGGQTKWGIIDSVMWGGVGSGQYDIILAEPLAAREISIHVEPRGGPVTYSVAVDPQTDNLIRVAFVDATTGLPRDTDFEITIDQIMGPIP